MAKGNQKAKGAATIPQNVIDMYKKFMDEWKRDPVGRFHSYDYCKKVFERYYDKGINGKLTPDEKDYIALHLFAYLGSWGMLRGSGWLLQKSYRALIPLVDVLYQAKYKPLLNIDPFALNFCAKDYAELVVDLSEKIYNTCESEIGETPTLLFVCKIIMATYGCVPSYDDYVKKALGQLGAGISRNAKKLNKNILCSTIDLIKANQAALQAAQDDIKATYDVEYTIFKVLDMILWGYGATL